MKILEPEFTRGPFCGVFYFLNRDLVLQALIMFNKEVLKRDRTARSYSSVLLSNVQNTALNSYFWRFLCVYPEISFNKTA